MSQIKMKEMANYIAAEQGLTLFSLSLSDLSFCKEAIKGAGTQETLSLGQNQPNESETYSKREITGFVSVKMLLLQRCARLLVPACVTSDTCGERIAWNCVRTVA